MAKNSTIITVPQMVDLALNSPEIGIVNFTVLHSLLHVIVQQMELTECSVEFRGSDSERLKNYISTAKPGPIITLTEYTIGPEGKEKPVIKSALKKRTADEKGQVDEGQSEKKADEAKSLQTIVVVEPKNKEGELKEPAHFTIAITQDHYDQLMKDMKDLKEKVMELSELPTNIGLVEALRAAGKDKPSPVLDMFHILTLNKRMDANEQAVNKLASIIEDLAKEKMGVGPLIESQVMKDPLLQDIDERLTNLENMLATGEFTMPIQTTTMTKTASTAETKPGEQQESQVPQEQEEPEVLKESIGSGIDLLAVNIAEMPIPDAMMMIQVELQRLRRVCGNEFLDTIKDLEKLKDALNSDEAPPDVRLGQLEIQIQTCMEQIASLDTMYNNQISIMGDKVAALTSDMLHVGENLVLGASVAGGPSEVEVLNKLAIITDETQAMHITLEKLWEEREGRQNLLDIISENVEILKNVKADKEEVEEALSEKADACVVNKKVSLDTFEETKQQLILQIEENETKLKEQETLFSHHLAEILEALDSKTNNADMEELKALIADKLKIITDRVDALAAIKDDPEAAGTKSKFLKNVNCISCDTKAKMRRDMDPALYPKKPGMPAAKTMGPYLAYEMDKLRKQQKCFNTKKTTDLQNLIQTGRSEDDRETCNRYCGGSHTVTTPQQRVTRIGHFLEQWGPEISPANEEVIKGTDGKMYKARDDDDLKKLLAKKDEKTKKVPSASLLEKQKKGASDQEQAAKNLIKKTQEKAVSRRSSEEKEKEESKDDGNPLSKIGDVPDELKPAEGSLTLMEAMQTDDLADESEMASVVPRSSGEIEEQ